jgi:hypothetical protein
LHWMDFDAFYAEVKRVAKPGAVIAAFVYSLLEAGDPIINNAIRDFYFKDSAPYWDKERRWVDEAYATIPFPFPEIAAPPFTMEYEWTLADIAGYINTWSACQHYRKQVGRSLVEEKLLPALKEFPMDKVVRVQFPVYTRFGRT